VTASSETLAVTPVPTIISPDNEPLTLSPDIVVVSVMF
jgi:hypothetical protein